jgi:hypothetical protein
MSTLNFEPFARIEELEKRVEQLEAALRKIADVVDAAIYGPMPKRQENSDVGPGFRGNNDHA